LARLRPASYPVLQHPVSVKFPQRRHATEKKRRGDRLAGGASEEASTLAQ
jgi:hypothetical protein